MYIAYINAFTVFVFIVFKLHRFAFIAFKFHIVSRTSLGRM